MGRIIPAAWLTPARIHRVVLHWTAGAYVVSAVDEQHYHCIIGRETTRGAIVAVRGDHTPADNDNTADDDYAAHTRGLNTGSYGLSVACMAGAVQGKSDGRFPLTEALWERLILATADVCEVYRLAVTERTVLFHSEVQEVYGKPQRGKWDIDTLPFAPTLRPAQIHDQFREKVKAAIRPRGQDDQ